MNTAQCHKGILECIDRNGLEVEIDFDVDLLLFDDSFYVWIESEECYGTRQPISGYHFFLNRNGMVIGWAVNEDLVAVESADPGELNYWQQLDCRR